MPHIALQAFYIITVSPHTNAGRENPNILLTPPLHFVSVLLQEKFSADQTVVELAGLLPATDYSVTLYALYDEDPSDPVTAVATTCKTFPTNVWGMKYSFNFLQIFLYYCSLLLLCYQHL